jgi:hypothetical protein
MSIIWRELAVGARQTSTYAAIAQAAAMTLVD